MADADPIMLARFWAKVDVRGANQCWPWRGKTVKGYGRFDAVRAHRFAYEAVVAPVSDGLLVRHLCRNKLCCNPRHLKPGTDLENAADEVAAGATMSGERHGQSKLSAAQVAHIRASSARGCDLALAFGVAQSTISEIRSGRWRKAR